MREQVKWCGCMAVRSWRDGLADLFSRELVDGKRRGEIYELFEVKSFEEFKDELKVLLIHLLFLKFYN